MQTRQRHEAAAGQSRQAGIVAVRVPARIYVVSPFSSQHSLHNLDYGKHRQDITPWRLTFLTYSDMM
jgi:hypothetical protein